MESTADFKDRKGLLIFFGIILLMTGGLCLLFSLLMLFTIALPQPVRYADPQLPLSSLFLSIFFYVAMAAVFIALGIGSIQARRWAQSLTLLLSWLILLTGVVTIVFMIFYSGYIFEQIGVLIQDDPMFLEFISMFMYVFIIGFFIIAPGIFILAYRSKSVIETVRKYDRKESWTDKCPLLLTAHIFFLLFSAVAPLFLISYGFVAPLFGIFIGGWPAALLWLANSVICMIMAMGVYRLNIHAWHNSLYLLLFWLISASITLLYNDWVDIYNYLNVPSELLSLMGNMEYLSNRDMFIMIFLTLVSYLIYYFYGKKYFKRIED